MQKKSFEKIICNAKRKSLYVIIILTMLFCGRKDDLQKGISALEKGNYSKAIKQLSAALELDPLNPKINFNLSLAYVHLDSVQKACYHYSKIDEADPYSDYKDDKQLRIMLATSLNMEPYPSRLIPMKGMHQFKGAFSPGGNTIAVAAAKQHTANIYLARSDGSIIKQITKRGMNTDPDYSPTGDRIVFASDADGDDELYVYDLKSKQLEKITDNTARDISPSFSPEGEEIVFVSNMDDANKHEIYKMNIENKNIKRLTKNNYWDGFPKFSSDGKAIVFSSKRNGSEDIYTMKANGGREKVLYESTADENDPLLFDETLYFKSNQDGEWEIYRYNLKSGKLMRLTYNSYPDWNPRISRDGTKIVVSRKIRNRWRLYLIDLDKPISADRLLTKIKKKVSL